MRATRSILAVGPALALAATVTSGCGSLAVADYPAPARPAASPPLDPAQPPAGTTRFAEPADPDGRTRGSSATLRDGSERLEIDARAREVVAVDVASGREVARAPAGIGPTAVVTNDEDHGWVIDTAGGAVLVVRRGRGDELRVERRVHLPGSPAVIAKDPDARVLWVALTARNELVRLGAHRRPVPRERYPTTRDVRALTILEGGDPVVRAAGRAARRVRAP